MFALGADVTAMSSRRSVIPTRDDAVAIATALDRGDADVVRVIRGLQRDWDEESRAGASNNAERQLRALIEVAAAAAAAHHLDEVLDLAAEHALAATGAASLSISRWDALTETIQTLINVGQLAPCEERWPVDEVYRAADLPLWSALFSGVPQLCAVDDPGLDPVYRELLQRLGKESSIGVAIRFRGEVWGELWATTAPGEPRFSGDDVVFLQTIARQLGAAIGRAELFDQIAALAYTDPLTGLANRRALDDALDLALSRPERAVALIVCDVDGLKHVNDELGHAAGDAIIVNVGEALSAAVAGHEGAMVSRLGGDEFCVLLPVGGLDAARAVAGEAIGRLHSLNPPLRIACGAAAARGGPASALLHAADAAQYAAKRLGGDVLRIAATPESEGPDLPCAIPRRRSYRDDEPHPRLLITDALAALDGELANASAADRLAALAARLATAVDATDWAVGFAPAGKGRVKTIRTSRVEKLFLPRAALNHTAGFVCFAEDEAGPVASQLMHAQGIETCIGVATPIPEGTWLTVLFSDRRAACPTELLAEIRLLALAATSASAVAPGKRGRAAA